jgi:hypothetical protein
MVGVSIFASGSVFSFEFPSQRDSMALVAMCDETQNSKLY